MMRDTGNVLAVLGGAYIAFFHNPFLGAVLVVIGMSGLLVALVTVVGVVAFVSIVFCVAKVTLRYFWRYLTLFLFRIIFVMVRILSE